MKSSQFSYQRPAFVKRVASVCSIGLALSLSACGSHGLSFGGGSDRYSDEKEYAAPIPSEPVYGYPDKAEASSDPYGRSVKPASFAAKDSEPSIKRASLTPVRTASYDGGQGGSYVGGTYAMQPVSHDGGHSADKTTASSGVRYAQASGPSYYGSRSTGYQPSYSDYKPHRRRPAPRYDEGSYKKHDAPRYKAYDRPRARKKVYDPGYSKSHGKTYIVVEGDTLFGISRRFGVTTTELAEANGIIGSTIYAGQPLKIPGGPKYTAASKYDTHVRRKPRHSDYPSGYSRRHADSYDDEERKAPPARYSGYNGRRSYTSSYDDPRDKDHDVRHERPGKRYARHYDEPKSYDRPRGPVRRHHKPKGSYFTYSVERGDTLYEIARRHGLGHHELAAFNDIPISATLYPGQVLHIPKGHGRPYSRKSPDESDKAARAPKKLAKAEERAPKTDVRGEVKSEPRTEPTAASGETGEPSAEGREPKTILAAHRDADDTAVRPRPAAGKSGECESLLAQPVARSAKTFREPVQGLIVAKFGAGKDGSFNDGIDFSVPKGTPVKAAENGVVAYVGDELPGFGNLVLVRHADGYVTAYAHNDEVMVKRCDIVKRGQIIAKAGATGNVTKPQLHFELRKNSKAVDPETYFSRS